MRDERGDTQRHADREQRAGHRQERGDDCAECDEQQHQRHRKRARLGAPRISRARPAQVGVECQLPGPSHRRGGMVAPERCLESARRLAQRVEQYICLTLLVEAHDHERATRAVTPCVDEERLAAI